MKEIYQQYNKQAQFYLIYVREAHPGGEIKQPETWEERREIASNFVADVDFPMPTLVDTIDNKTENDYRAWPDRIYIVDEDGKIAYKGAKGPMGFEPAQIIEVLETWSGVEPANRLTVTWGALKTSL